MPEIIKAGANDLRTVADCHIRAFPDTLSAKFGISFVAKSLEPFVTDDNKFLLFIPEGGVCAGYVSGIFTDANSGLGSASSMLQSAMFEGVLAVAKKPRLLLEPELRARLPFIWKNVKHRLFGKRGRDHASASARPETYRSVGIPGICVHPDHRRKGYASKLMLAAEERAYRAGFRHMHSTVANTNTASAECHFKLGYKATPQSATAMTMRKSLDY